MKSGLDGGEQGQDGRFSSGPLGEADTTNEKYDESEVGDFVALAMVSL